MVLGRFFPEIVGRECWGNKYRVIDHAGEYRGSECWGNESVGEVNVSVGEVNVWEIKVSGKKMLGK
ncbi:26747_t:CDS:2 [Gigaspora margarita]|uniref:26747_t:CDS:1 n=1 Tax=Gigaspora margarita TaxID=4874 RepID=A0ABN7UC67_GIGMA|nr:26747_t:CDS:2 [Gigaspora margarita]